MSAIDDALGVIVDVLRSIADALRSIADALGVIADVLGVIDDALSAIDDTLGVIDDTLSISADVSSAGDHGKTFACLTPRIVFDRKNIIDSSELGTHKGYPYEEHSGVGATFMVAPV